MAAGKANSKSPTIRRILREAQELAAAPSADFAVAPLESDLFEWHFTFRGPPNSVYADGLYHGRIVLPPTYPLRPPSFRFVTPSGRFEANREICLSISGHHEETWQPAWGLRTALVALRAFMETDPRGQVGGLDASAAVRRRLAAESARFTCPTCRRSNAEILAESAAAEAAVAAEGGTSPSTTELAVPPELKLVFRDELEPKPTETEDTKESGETAGAGPAAAAAAAAATLSPPPAAPAHAVPSVPTPTRPRPRPPYDRLSSPPAVTAAPAQQPNAPLPPPRQRRPLPSEEEAVPLWVDRTLVVLCVVLAAMLLRVVFG